MSKVICDICGTTFPETASVCPICGCAKNTTEQTVADIASSDESVAATYTKGGHFSKSNVRKRNQQKATTKNQPEGDGVNKGLVVVVVLLLLAIAAVLIYIGVRFFVPTPDNDPADTGNRITTSTTPSSSVISDPDNVPCTELKLSCTTIELTKEGDALLLNVTALPENTTDKITFASSDVNVATVSENGNVVVVGSGEAVITVTCGTVTAECKVIGAFDGASKPSEPSEPTEPPVNIPEGFVLKLNRKDFTLTKQGESWQLFKETSGVKPSDITWTVDDPKVATVENGKVVGVNYGDTKIHAVLGDQEVTCTVRVRFRVEEGSENPVDAKINRTDVTIKTGETFTLTLTNSEGVKLDVEWTASEEGFVTIDGTRITGKADTAPAGIKISCTYQEKTFSCIVRVRTPEKTEE